MFLCFKTPDFRYVVKQIDLLLNLLIKPSLLWSVLGFVHPRKFIDLCRDLPPCQEPHALEGQWRQHKMQNFKYILINIKTGTFAFEIFPDSVTSSWYPVRSLWRMETFHLQRYRFLFIKITQKSTSYDALIDSLAASYWNCLKSQTFWDSRSNECLQVFELLLLTCELTASCAMGDHLRDKPAPTFRKTSTQWRSQPKILGGQNVWS